MNLYISCGLSNNINKNLNIFACALHTGEVGPFQMLRSKKEKKKKKKKKGCYWTSVKVGLIE